MFHPTCRHFNEGKSVLKKDRPPSITDVAHLAGVSYQTVSRVINKPQTVATNTRLRVEQAIKTLGYRPNNAARMLKTNRSRMIGVICSDSQQFGPTSTLNAIHQAAQAVGYGIQVAYISQDSNQDPQDCFQMLVGFGVEGIIVITTQKWINKALTAHSHPLPVVLVSSGGQNNDQVSSVCVNQFMGAQLAVNHLLEQGFTEINHLAGPRQWYDAEDRLAGWKAIVEQADHLHGSWAEGDWSEISGYQYAQSIYPKLPESVFVANDQMSLGILRFFWEKGVKVPQDIAIVGFDDIPSASFYCPSLTTIQQPFSQLGINAVQMLLGRLDGQTASRMIISPTLIIRDSSVA